jgi:hypothetical protein
MRHKTATTDAGRTLYAERLGVLRVVMRECRSNDNELRFAASQMTRSMSDISSDEEFPNNGLFTNDMCAVLDDAQRAVDVGAQLVETLATNSNTVPASSSHVNAVADAMVSMLSSNGQEAAEEKMQTDSDVETETQSERGRRYMSSAMCEVSDPEEWMVYRHGQSSESDTDAEVHPWNSFVASPHDESEAEGSPKRTLARSGTAMRVPAALPFGHSQFPTFARMQKSQ